MKVVPMFATAAVAVASLATRRARPPASPLWASPQWVVRVRLGGDIYLLIRRRQRRAIVTGPATEYARRSHATAPHRVPPREAVSSRVSWSRRRTAAMCSPHGDGGYRPVRLVGRRLAAGREPSMAVRGSPRGDRSSGVVRPLDLGDIEPGDRVDWRPTDGHELVFTGHAKTGSPTWGCTPSRPDGTGLRTIGAISTTESDERLVQRLPAVADGSTVAYWAWGPNAAGVSDGYAHLRDLVIGVDHRLAVRPQAEAEVDPQFSPDGTLIVVEAQSESEDRSQLVVGPVDGSRPGVAIGPTFSYKDDDAFAFSPDGTKIVLTVNDTTSILDIATGETTTLPGITSYPSWQRLRPT